ncbi:hypothetical protein C0J52_07791 [Blattella germanica]|nr:hypothetical protein C0J52_07791 [Blattella germanica]
MEGTSFVIMDNYNKHFEENSEIESVKVSFELFGTWQQSVPPRTRLPKGGFEVYLTWGYLFFYNKECRHPASPLLGRARLIAGGFAGPATQDCHIVSFSWHCTVQIID